MSDSLTIWLTLVCGALGTFVIRLSFLALLAKRDVPRLVRRALNYVPASVLAALVFPAVFAAREAGAAGLHVDWVRAAVLIVCALLAWKTRNMLLTVIVGMVLLTGIEAALG